jgi:hypothetical protein
VSIIELAGHYIYQGNSRGIWTSTPEAVLYTSGIDPCVAVCGFDGQVAFMIHSDTMGNSGVGSTALIDGLRMLLPAIGYGAGWSLALVGGSSAAVAPHLAKHLPYAEIYDHGWSEGAYITGGGIFARNKRQLAEALGGESVTIHDPHALS